MIKLDPLKKNAVTVCGNPSADGTIVFVHGFGTDQTAWQDVANPFLDDYRIVLFDNAGAGRADPAGFVQHHYLQLQAYAHDLIDIGKVLQLQHVIGVGHSVGAMIGLLAAIEQPTLFSKLVLIGASPRYLNDENYHGGFTKSDLNELYSAVMDNYAEWADAFAHLAMATPEKPQLSKAFAASLKNIPSSHALTVLCSIFQSDHRAELEKLDIPTLLIHSSQDIAVPVEVAHYLHRHIRGSRLQFVNATGHLPHISAPAEVIAAIRDFI